MTYFLLLFFITSNDSIKVKKKKRNTSNHTLVSKQAYTKSQYVACKRIPHMPLNSLCRVGCKTSTQSINLQRCAQFHVADASRSSRGRHQLDDDGAASPALRRCRDDGRLRPGDDADRRDAVLTEVVVDEHVEQRIHGTVGVAEDRQQLEHEHFPAGNLHLMLSAAGSHIRHDQVYLQVKNRRS